MKVKVYIRVWKKKKKFYSSNSNQAIKKRKKKKVIKQEVEAKGFCTKKRKWKKRKGSSHGGNFVFGKSGII